jgi:hypothetical protein
MARPFCPDISIFNFLVGANPDIGRTRIRGSPAGWGAVEPRPLLAPRPCLRPPQNCAERCVQCWGWEANGLVAQTPQRPCADEAKGQTPLEGQLSVKQRLCQLNIA